jgi:hypothetical protein
VVGDFLPVHLQQNTVLWCRQMSWHDEEILFNMDYVNKRTLLTVNGHTWLKGERGDKQ